jgi:hypothetical protein
MAPHRQNAHLTHKANARAGRHGWLRLTPAYSVRLVRERVEHLPAGSVVTDPFSGTGTSPLAAAEHGCTGQALDVNPFLVWLGNVKVRGYEPGLLSEISQDLPRITREAAKWAREAPGLWEPKLHNIGRWWSGGSLAALKALRHVLDETCFPQAGSDLLNIAFCRTAIASSNAAFNHQSMSFKPAAPAPALAGPDECAVAIRRFAGEAREILGSAAEDLPASGKVIEGDARELAGALVPCDLLITSPPYVNRMSYIRELRPYMYWLRYLENAREAGELDWLAIGGTWGTATSRLGGWAPDGTTLPIDAAMRGVCQRILQDGDKSGPLLATYVMRYFHDMFQHFQAAFRHVKKAGRITYIIGNSAFYGNLVPAQQWYAVMLREIGFTGVRVSAIRKRNSNLALYEYEVTGTRP